MLTLCDIRKSFGDKTVLDGASLSVKRGEIAVISGVSGGGKTTLMRIAAGLETADGGAVTREGRLAVVFAEARLFAGATVLENVTLVMNGTKKENVGRAMKILEALGLSDAASLYPREISTGMAARVSLARAMAFDADIYLLDEPLKSLDAEWKRSVMGTLAEFFHTKAVFMISHDETEAKTLATARYALMDGKLVRIN